MMKLETSNSNTKQQQETHQLKQKQAQDYVWQ